MYSCKFPVVFQLAKSTFDCLTLVCNECFRHTVNHFKKGMKYFVERFICFIENYTVSEWDNFFGCIEANHHSNLPLLTIFSALSDQIIGCIEINPLAKELKLSLHLRRDNNKNVWEKIHAFGPRL